MGFQYDSDDLGYEWGYDKPSNIPSETTQSFMGEGDSPIVVYECQMSLPPPPGATDASGIITLPTPPTTATGSAENAGDKKADPKAGDKKERKSSLQKAPPPPEPSGKQAAAAAQKPATPAKAEAGSAEAAKQEALRDPKYKTLEGGNPGATEKTKALLDFLNGKTPGRGWTTKPGPIVGGKQTFQIIHKNKDKGGAVDDALTINYTGDEEAQSTQWKLGTKAPQPTTAEITAENTKISAAVASGEKLLNGVEDKKTAKDNLEKNGWKVTEASENPEGVSVKGKTITVKASKDGQEYRFEVKDGKAKNTHAPEVRAAATKKEEAHPSTEETKLDGLLTREGASSSTIERWKAETLPPLQPATAEVRKKAIQAEIDRFDGRKGKKGEVEVEGYLQQVPKDKDPKRGESFLQERRAAYQLEKIRQKLTSKDGAGATSADVRDALEARGFVLKDLPGAAGYKIVGRTQIDGTVSLNEKDISDLTHFNADVQAGKFDKKEDLAVDTQRHLLVRAYLSQTKEEGQGILAGLGYIDEKGNPTEFKVAEFQQAMFSEFGGFTRPQPEQLKSYVDSFRSYQEKLKVNEQYRNSELSGLAPDSKEAETINRRYDGAALKLRKDFQGEIAKKLKSEKDPNVREYMQEQLQASGFNETDPKKFDQDKFAGSITSGYFVRSVNQYQSDLQRNEELRNGELTALGDHGPKGKHPDQKKIKEINDKFDGSAKELRTKFDQEMDKQLKEADPATRDYMKSKLEASGYYTRGQPDANWKPAQVDELSKSIALPHVQSPGVAKRPNEALVDGLKKAEEKASKEALKHKDDPDKLREIADDLKKRTDHLLEKADPVTQSRIKQVMTQSWVDKVHERLKSYGFTDGDARAIERSWGLIDRMDGKASPKIEANVAREKFEYLIGADNGGVLPARTAILRNALKSYRQDLPPALGGNLGLSGETIAKGMQAKGYFGPTEKVKPGTLEKMARDLERVEVAKEAKEKGDTNAFQQLSKEYEVAARTTTLPSAGTPEGNQAVIAVAKADQAAQSGGSAPADASVGEKTEKEGDTAAPVTTGNRGKKDRHTLDREQRAKEHAENRKDTRSRIELERAGATLREKEFALNKQKAETEKLQNAERMEFEREKLEVEKEKVSADRAFQDKQQRRQLEMQMLTTLIQALTSVLTSVIGMVGQLISAQISSNINLMASVVSSQNAPRR